MKRTLIILTLAALLVLPLIIAGCGCGGGANLTESDIATIRADHSKLSGYGERLDSNDSAIAEIRGVTDKLDDDTLATLEALAKLDADTLTKLADLEEDELDALLGLKDWQDDLKDPNKDGSLADVEARLEELESGQPSGNGGDGGTAASGEVTVTLGLGEGEEVVQFISGSSPASQVFPVKITNGTSEYKQVAYNVTLRCVSSDFKADVVQDGVDDEDGPDFAMTVNGVPMSTNPMPNTLILTDCANCETTGDDETGVYKDCQFIYFLWADPGKIPLAPGAATVAYITLNNFATSSGYEVWEVTLSGISVTEL